MHPVVQQLLTDLHQTSLAELVAVILGIASVVYSRQENILVYPVGMVSTAIFIYLYLVHGLYADASVNFYYTVMSIQGWILWSRRAEPVNRKSSIVNRESSAINDRQSTIHALRITASDARDWRNALVFFFVCWILLYVVLRNFTDSTVPMADSFTSGAAFTGMWLMNKKKLENWIWWIITDLASVPLNFYKHLVFASLQYLVFLVLATMGYITWRKKIGYGGT